MRLPPTTRVLAALGAAALVVACHTEPAPHAVERGRAVYMANCATCHNPDPRQTGIQGPPIVGASRALVEACVLHAGYPPGYTPKQATHLMPVLPQLAGNIDDLTAFLNAPGEKPGTEGR